jgi:hypothetical protein
MHPCTSSTYVQPTTLEGLPLFRHPARSLQSNLSVLSASVNDALVGCYQEVGHKLLVSRLCSSSPVLCETAYREPNDT